MQTVLQLRQKGWFKVGALQRARSGLSGMYDIHRSYMI